MTTFPDMSQWSKETKEINHQSSKENMIMSRHPPCHDTCCEALDAPTNQEINAFVE